MSYPTAKSCRVVWLRRLGLVVLLLAGLFVLFVIGALFLPTRVWLVLEALLFGWWQFANRNLPLITLNWDLLGMAAVCVLGVLALSHLLLRQFARWRLRWTIALNGLLWLSFFIATAVAGVVEQARWLREGDHEPVLIVRKWGMKSVNAASTLAMSYRVNLVDGQDLKSATAAVRREWQEEFSSPRGRYRDFRVFYLIDPTNGFAGVIAFRRPEIVHPDKLVGVSSPETGTTAHPPEQLPQLLSQPGLTAVPLF